MKTLLSHGLVFDGTGQPGRIAHVLMADGQVVSVSEERPDGVFDREIDATGQWVMPGFLDTHTHYDAELLAEPGIFESVRHGVTTVFVGSCSLGTVLAEPLDGADLFSRVEALPHASVLSTLEEHKTWSTPSGWIDALHARPLGPNVAAFLGHSDLRSAVMGIDRATDASVRPTKEEQVSMEGHLHSALDAGFLGLSTMTNPWDKVGGDRYRSRKLPSTYATWTEYRRFHRILRKRDRVLQSAPNITTKVNMFAFMAESIGLGLRKALKTTLITAADPKSNPFISDLATFAASLCNRLFGGNLRWQTVPMPFEVYADGMDLVVFEEFGAGEAALHLSDALERDTLLQDEEYRRWFRKDYDRRFGPRVWHRDFHDATIVSAPDETLVGQSFGGVADALSIHPVDAFLDLVVKYGSALRWKTTIANHRPGKLASLMARDSVQVSFSDAGAHVRNMAFYNFPLYLLRMVKDGVAEGRASMSLEKAVHKLTGELADWFGVDAGHLRPGDRADVVVVDPGGLDESIDEIHEAPMQLLGGIPRMVRRNDRAVTATFIAGELVFERGEFTPGYGQDRRTGSFLRAGGGTSRDQPLLGRVGTLS
jgi:N-acyl-D-glutamate deacylase